MVLRPSVNMPLRYTASASAVSEALIRSGITPISARPGHCCTRSLSSEMPPPKSPYSTWRCSIHHCTKRRTYFRSSSWRKAHSGTLVGRVHPRQVGDVGVHPRVQPLALGGGVLLDQEAPVVAHLVEAVGQVLPLRPLARLEHQAPLGAVQRGGVEAGRGAGHADPQA